MRLLDKTFLLWHLGLGPSLCWPSAGWAGDLRTGLSFLVYGMFLRLV